MANRVLVGKKGSDYVLQISKPGTDVTGSVNTRDLLFNSLDNYRSGVIVSDTDVTTMTTSGVNLPTTADTNSNNYIPAYQVIEKGVRTPVYYFIDDRTTGGVGFDFEATMQSGVPTTGGGGLFEFSLSGSGSTVNTVKAAFIDIVESEPIVNHGLSGYDYFGTNNYPFIELRTRGSGDGNVNILMLRIPCQYGKMTNDATLFGTSVLTPATSGGGGSGGGGSIEAPADPTVTLSTRTSTTDTVSVSSSSGSGNSGTITFAQTTTDVTPSSGFTTTTSYSQPRNSTRYYWASQGGYISGSTSFVSPAYDNTPTQFTFTDITGAALSTTQTSNTITIAGLDNGDSALVSVSGGTYSKNGGAYTSSGGTAVNGDTFAVRQTSSGSYSTVTNCILTVGTVSDTYSVTTRSADNVPDGYNFTNQTGLELSTLTYSNTETITGLETSVSVSISGNSAQFSINGGTYTTSGTISNNQTLRLRMNSSGSYSTTVSTTVNVGGVTDVWSITTRAQVLASTPNAPTVTQTNNPSGSVNVDVTSSGGSGTIQVSNDNSNWYSNGQDFTHARGSTVTYYARCVSTDNDISSSASTAKFVPPTVTLGAFSNVSYNSSGGTNNYTITTQKSTGNFNTYSSYWGTVSYSVSNNSGGWLTSSITNASSGAYSLTASSFSTVGGSRSATVSYTVSTQFGYQYTGTFTVSQDGPVADTTPDQFTFVDVYPATQGTTYTDSETITGINTGATLTFTGTTGADYKINSGSYTTSSQTVYNNDVVTVRVVAASSAGVGRYGTVTIGGVSDTFTVATAPDLVPDQFTFTDVTDASLTSTSTSTITLSGMTSGFYTNATFSGSSQADFRVNSGTYSQSSKAVTNGDTITARVVLVSGATGVDYSTTYNAAITVGGVSDTFSVTTEADPGQTTT